jgi:hypothetical protein
MPRLLFEWYWWVILVMFFLVGRLPASEEAAPIMMDLRVVAVLAVVGGFVWWAGVMMQVYRQWAPGLTRRAAWTRRLRWGGMIAVYALALPAIAVFTAEADDFGKPGQALAYYFARAVARVAGAFASGWLARSSRARRRLSG